ncbi:MAG: diguanylate cyclase with hemerythrin-like metal-binding domain [Comamonadaceae bacterium]|nr:MAG: diguanylate cyclase with hemerythrin-like metal-binding domain [Comamonadaceae bacterium]
MQDMISMGHFSIFLGSVTLAAWVAWISFDKDRGLTYWAAALASLAVVYGFLSLRIPLSPIFSVVLANVALACTLALVAECVVCWQSRQSLHGLIWLPVLVAALGFWGWLDNPQGRIMFGAGVFAIQSLLILVLLLQKRKQLRSTGFFLVELTAALAACLFVLRAAFTLSGRKDVVPLVVSDQIQASTLLLFLVSVMLLTMGFELLGGSVREDDATTGV